MVRADYSPVTETPGDEITREAASMLLTRYEHAAHWCVGKDVLEVACGSGQGLGYLARRARRVVGGDCTERLLGAARRHYRGRIPLVGLDAQRLPFKPASFDVVILHEAIYYLDAPDAFVRECRRVLRPTGTVVLWTVNREWADFNPSAFSHWYPTARDLATLLGSSFGRVQIYGAFPASARSFADLLISFVKHVAIRFHLIPRTMSGKRLLKRLFFGSLVRVPAEITADLAPYSPPELLEPARFHPDFKVLCAVATA